MRGVVCSWRVGCKPLLDELAATGPPLWNFYTRLPRDAVTANRPHTRHAGHEPITGDLTSVSLCLPVRGCDLARALGSPPRPGFRRPGAVPAPSVPGYASCHHPPAPWQPQRPQSDGPPAFHRPEFPHAHHVALTAEWTPMRIMPQNLRQPAR